MSRPPTETDRASLAAKAAALTPAQRAMLERKLRERAAAAPREKPIVRRRQTVAPLSFAQELLWLVDQLSPDQVNYNVPRMMRLRGPLNVAAMEKAVTTIVERHEVLRSSIVVVDGSPIQKVRPAAPTLLRLIDLTSDPENVREERAVGVMTGLIKRPFDLTRDDLLRPTVIRLGPEEHILLIESHHIASDGWSKGVLFNELERLYEAHCKGVPVELPELPIQYADYSLWQRETLSDLVLKNELIFWRDHLSGAPPLLEFPSAKRRPAVQNFKGRGQRFHFSKATLDAAQQLSTREASTLFMTLLAAFEAFVARYTGQTDLVIGTPIAGRNRPEQESLIGYFTNTLAIRTDLGGDPTFRQAIKRVRQTALSAYEHQDLPFEVLVKELRPDRNLSHSPLFQVMFSVGHAVQMAPALYKLETSPVFVERGTSRFDLLFGATALPDGLTLACEYNTDLFEDDTIRQMVKCFETLLEAALASPDSHISELPLLKPEDLGHQIVEWNKTNVSFPDACVHELFELQVDRTPSAVAVQDGDEILTYRQLDERANQIARWLISRGAGIETPIGVCLNRSTLLASTLLGVLKAGCACVLLDPSFPSGRLVQMATDADLLMLLADGRQREALTSYPRTVFLDDETTSIAAQMTTRPGVSVKPTNLAYILYTSGSTGIPKGVLLEHRGMVNHHAAVAKMFELGPSDRVLQFALLGFDICLEEMFPTWLTGGAVVFRSDVIGGREFLTWLERNQITIMDVPTAFWHEWVHDLDSLNARPPDSLRLLIVGGEKASRSVYSLWRKIVRPSVRWLNTYGPTEASIIATAYEPAAVADDERFEIPIGRPIANAQIYILDKQMKPVPVGVPGELFIGGAGVARGYLHRPELSAQKFVPNPFIAEGRLYATGDLARFRSDGNIEFAGRTDDQLKIRGFRVEPGEIEAVLTRQPGVQQAVVIGTSGANAKLVAYVVPMTNATVDPLALRASLQQLFPQYMVPSAFVSLDALPTTAQGKLDRAKLPAPDQSTIVEERNESIAPRSATEETLVGIWEKVLDRQPIGVRDDFFEIGGHSLLAVRLLAAVRQTFGADLPLATLFTARTVESLAQAIEGKGQVLEDLPTVMPIQTAGSRLPLFCVSRPNVNSLGYVFLARHLGADQPVYGLQSHLRDASREPYTQEEFRTTAATYIASMRALQPHGPYFLMGNCEGAQISFEMGRQLHQAGEKVGAIAILDAWPQEHTRRYYLFLASYYAYQVRLFFRENAASRRRLLRQRASRMLSLLSKRVRRASVTQKSTKQADPMVARYWPGSDEKIPTYPGDVVLFRIAKQPYWRINDPSMGWGIRAQGGVEIVPIPGRHQTVLREPAVSVIANYMRSRMTRVIEGAPVGADALRPVTSLPFRAGFVSVVIPAHNSADTVVRAIESVFRQDYPAKEILVVDDGSTDATINVLSRYGGRIQVIHSDLCQGASRARNIGVAAATGEFVAFLDADDEWLPGKLSAQVDVLGQEARMPFAATAATLIGEDGRSMGLLNNGRPPATGDDAWKTLLEYNYIATPTVLARRDAVLAASGFDPELPAGEDQDLWIRLALMGPVGYVEKPFVLVHDRPDSLSKRHRVNEIGLVLPMIRRHLNENRQLLSPQERRRILAARYSKLGRNAYSNGSRMRGAALLTRAIVLGHEPMTNALYLAKASPLAMAVKRRLALR